MRLATACALLLVARARPAEAQDVCPSWTRGGGFEERYPAKQFLTAVGTVAGVWDEAEGKRRGTAEALKALGFRLSAMVRAAIETRAWEGTEQGAGSSVSDHARITTSLEVRGATPVESCFDHQGATYHVLVALDGVQARADYEARVLAANQRAADAMTALKNAVRTGDALDALRRVKALRAIAEEVVQDARVLSALGKHIQPFVVAGDLTPYYETARGALRLRMLVDGDAVVTATAVRDALSRARIQVVTGNAAPTSAQLVLRGTVAVVRSSRSGLVGASVVDVRATLELLDRSTGMIVRAIAQSARGVDATEQGALDKANQKLGDAIGQQLEQAISSLTSS